MNTNAASSCMNMLELCSSECSLCKEANNIRIFHTTLAKWGSAQTCLVRVDLDVYFSLTYTNEARCGGRREVPSLETRAVNMGRRGQGQARAEHSYKWSLRMLWRHEGGNSSLTLTFGARSPRREERQKNSPDLAKPQRAADVDCNCALCRFSINLTTTLRRLNSVYITFGSLPRRTSTRTKNEDCSALLFNPTVANLMYSK